MFYIYSFLFFHGLYLNANAREEIFFLFLPIYIHFLKKYFNCQLLYKYDFLRIAATDWRFMVQKKKKQQQKICFRRFSLDRFFVSVSFSFELNDDCL